MGWRLTCFSLLVVFSLTDSRPSLLSIGDGGHQGEHHEDHQEHHGDHQEHHGDHQEHHGDHQERHGDHHGEHHGVLEVEHQEDMQFLAEPYIHNEILAEPYIHEEIEAEPYIHQEIEAEPYIHQEMLAEPYIHQKIKKVRKLKKSHINPDPVDSISKTATSTFSSDLIHLPSTALVKSNDATNVEDIHGGAIKTLGSQTLMEDSNNLSPKPYIGEIAEVDFIGSKFDSETLKQDQSFKFSFSSSDYSRKEESDANGKVRGSYSYKNENGENIEVRYTAGADMGFVVENLDEVLAKSKPKELAQIKTPLDVIVVESNLPPLDVLSSKEDIIESLSPLPDYNEPIPLPISEPDTLYGAPSDSLPSYNEPEFSVPASLTADNPMMIMNPSYNFAYNNEDSSRVENANPDTGIITGQYSYTNPEGNEIVVKYRAGPGIGFVIENQEDLDAVVLKATEDGANVLETKAMPDTSLSKTIKGIENSDAILLNAANEKSPVKSKPYSGDIAEVEFVGPKINSETWEQDQSFKFGFKTSEQSRREESDANGNVQGSYSFKNENGENIEVKYTAGADTGFVVENLDEVLAKSKPKESTHTALPADEIVIESQTLTNKVDSIQDIDVSPLFTEELSGLYGAPSAPLPAYNEPPKDLPSYNEQEPAILSSLPADNPMMIMNPNYNFAYNNDDSSRTENANPDTGIITGHYSYTNPEGNEIEVKYRAGAGIGFVIENQKDLDAVILKATEDGAGDSTSKLASSFASPDSIPSVVLQHDNGANTIQPQRLYDAPMESLSSYNEEFLPTKNQETLSSQESLSSINEESLSSFNEETFDSFNEKSLASHNEESHISNNADDASVPISNDMDIVKDASFKFSVEEENQSFQEEADVNGERTGSYSYTSPDGELIVVRYRAGRDGFVILNPQDVLPKAPVHNF